MAERCRVARWKRALQVAWLCLAAVGGCDRSGSPTAVAPPLPSPPPSAAPSPAPTPAPQGERNADDPWWCDRDSDCVHANGGCCGCADGGPSVAVRATARDAYAAQLEAGCHVRCRPVAAETQHVSCSMRPACRDGRCKLVAANPLFGPPAADCKIDDDCTKAATCCGCSSQAIAKRVARQQAAMMHEQCQDAACPAVIDERPVCFAPVVCRRGTCLIDVSRAPARRPLPAPPLSGAGE